MKTLMQLTAIALIGGALYGCDRDSNYGASRQNDSITQSDPATASPTPSAADRSVGVVVDDSLITSKVKSALIADPDVKSFDISVETRNGEVMLSGFVDNQQQIEEAIRIARGIEGVQRVSNNMKVKG